MSNKVMKIVADIGATNSRWLIADGDKVKRLDRPGYNPVTHERSIWTTILASLNVDQEQVIDAAIYGAGFHPDKIERVGDYFRQAFPNTRTLMVAEDLLGTCHGTAGHHEGICVIMGTGSNSCHYDGKKIIKQINSMSHILGDEGSAFAIGKALLRAYVRYKMPMELHQAFAEKYPTPPLDIIAQVYKPQGNQYLGQFSKFASEHRDHPWIQELLMKCIGEMFDVLADYQRPDLTHYFTGGIAVNFPDMIAEWCEKLGIKSHKIAADSLDGLAKYHEIG
jgi:N-acetylglucosamine kinase-like BadF-type ATPase